MGGARGALNDAPPAGAVAHGGTFGTADDVARGRERSANGRVIVEAAPRYRLRLKEMAPDERPRERLKLRGPQSLSDGDLVAIILNTGVSGSGRTHRPAPPPARRPRRRAASPPPTAAPPRPAG